jgi:hypothetical protein
MIPGLFHVEASVPASVVPLDPLDPLDPLEPDVPLEPLEPELPFDPDEPFDPEVPLDPEIPCEPDDPGEPDVPLVLGAGSFGNVDAVGSKRSLWVAPLHATKARRLDATTSPAARGFIAAELCCAEPRCPTASTHESDSFPSLSTSPAGS